MTWMDGARSRIAELMKNVPQEATYEERKKILRAYSGNFHGGTSWGKKIWPKACKEYLAPFGPKCIEEVPKKHLSPLERLMAKSLK